MDQANSVDGPQPVSFNTALGFLTSGSRIKRIAWSDDSYIYMEGDRLKRRYGGIDYPQINICDLAERDWIILK